ncbi:hypothetical protein CSUB_C0007 [Candidatus Caldarchaeum subterraneum]|uniref:Uncharacterized protein n=1 Tax=Caldiarchaeum subterraneum TaxID=311458 RepID=E6N445_CALS0|nr:hypothetical protein HGMM_F51C10C19 [Candidatus Caldarchaeum subterraneum]BAJ49876.1 hypothetical protein CSUB_C0007 [Candidatus Caldarchaeum subterraneum]
MRWMSGCADSHDYFYYGALNIYHRSELLKVVDAWRCRRCGVLRVGVRGPEVLTSTEGMLPEPEDGKKWILLVCRHGEPPCFELLQLRDGESFVHKCAFGEESLTYIDGKGVFYGLDGPPATRCHVYELAKILKGYIEIGKNPPEVVSLIR